MHNKKRMFLIAVIAASSLSLAACQVFTRNAYTDNMQVSNTVKGAATGGLAAGGVAAAASANSTTTAAVAGGGAVIGGVVGHSMDKAEASMRARLRGTGVKVLENVNDADNRIILVMPSDVHFKPGSAELSPKFKTILDSVALEMKEFKYAVAEIPGNADSTGSKEYNQRLSERRAQAVADYLASRGIERERLVPRGYGESAPIASNKTAAGRALNRRVCVILHHPPIQ